MGIVSQAGGGCQEHGLWRVSHAHMHEKFTDGHLAPLSLQPNPPAVTLGKAQRNTLHVPVSLNHKATMPDTGW